MPHPPPQLVWGPKPPCCRVLRCPPAGSSYREIFFLQNFPEIERSSQGSAPTWELRSLHPAFATACRGPARTRGGREAELVEDLRTERSAAGSSLVKVSPRQRACLPGKATEPHKSRAAALTLQGPVLVSAELGDTSRDGVARRRKDSHAVSLLWTGTHPVSCKDSSRGYLWWMEVR